jgi:hypothetical protein
MTRRGATVTAAGKMICTTLMLINLAVLPTVDAQQKEDAFPNSDEIDTLLTQANRAMAQYKATVDLESKAGFDSESLATDRQLIEVWPKMLAALKQNPQGFNSEMGFLFVSSLDDASRNSAVCGGEAMRQSSIKLAKHETDGVEELLTLYDHCTSASTLLYTVSETAASLYRRYLHANVQLTNESVAAMQKCADTLSRATKKQPTN